MPQNPVYDDLLAKVSELNEHVEKLEADVKARDIFVENLEIYNQELISKLQSKCPDEELIKGYTNKIVEVAELKKEIKDTTEIYEKERAYLRELANKKGDEAERYAKLIHDKNEYSRKQDAKVSEQEKEIAAWKNVSERRAIEPQQLKKELSEQSQRIQQLEGLLKRIRHCTYARDTDDAILYEIEELLKEGGFHYESED